MWDSCDVMLVGRESAGPCNPMCAGVPPPRLPRLRIASVFLHLITVVVSIRAWWLPVQLPSAADVWQQRRHRRSSAGLCGCGLQRGCLHVPHCTVAGGWNNSRVSAAALSHLIFTHTLPPFAPSRHHFLLMSSFRSVHSHPSLSPFTPALHSFAPPFREREYPTPPPRPYSPSWTHAAGTRSRCEHACSPASGR